MGDINALAGEIANLFVGVGKDIYARFTQNDKDELARYAGNIAALALKLRTEPDPVKRAQILDNLHTYENAAKLMKARYEIIAASALEKTSLAALDLAISAIIKIVTQMV